MSTWGQRRIPLSSTWTKRQAMLEKKEAQRIATRHWSACRRGQIDAVKCRMEGPAVRNLGLVVGDGASAESSGYEGQR